MTYTDLSYVTQAKCGIFPVHCIHVTTPLLFESSAPSSGYQLLTLLTLANVSEPCYCSWQMLMLLNIANVNIANVSCRTLGQYSMLATYYRTQSLLCLVSTYLFLATTKTVDHWLNTDTTWYQQCYTIGWQTLLEAGTNWILT